jgi:hypothetical protein
MARVVFTANLQRHVPCPSVDVPGGTLRAVLDVVFASNERARGYVLDEQGELRKHMIIFIDLLSPHRRPSASSVAISSW